MIVPFSWYEYPLFFAVVIVVLIGDYDVFQRN